MIYLPFSTPKWALFHCLSNGPGCVYSVSHGFSLEWMKIAAKCFGHRNPNVPLPETQGLDGRRKRGGDEYVPRRASGQSVILGTPWSEGLHLKSALGTSSVVICRCIPDGFD